MITSKKSNIELTPMLFIDCYLLSEKKFNKKYGIRMRNKNEKTKDKK